MIRLIRGLVFFVFSCVPGCGQMHQGYMKRGVSQTILFCGYLTAVVFLEVGALELLLIPLWLYSFFDSYNLRRQRLEGVAEEDTYLFGMSELDARRLSDLFARRHSVIGWALVLVGLYLLYNTVARRVLSGLWNLFPWLDWLFDLLVWDIPRIAVTLLIIALGMWFIRGPRKRAPADDIPAFVPSRGEGDPAYAPEFFREAPHAPDVPAGGAVTAAETEEDSHGNG